jgi:hypothetical protein
MTRTVLTPDRAWQRLALPGILIETIRQPNPAR